MHADAHWLHEKVQLVKMFYDLGLGILCYLKNVFGLQPELAVLWSEHWGVYNKTNKQKTEKNRLSVVRQCSDAVLLIWQQTVE